MADHEQAQRFSRPKPSHSFVVRLLAGLLLARLGAHVLRLAIRRVLN